MINNRRKLEAWLRKQPRVVAAALAARAALRVLPIVQAAQGRGFEGNFVADIVLPVFRAAGVAWAAAEYPARATELSNAARVADAFAVLAASAAAADAAVFAAAAAATDAAVFAAAAAASAARAAVDGAFAADAAADALAAFAAATATTEGAFWSAVSFDATRVQEGRTASDIARLPLWPEGQPEPLQSLWQEMKAALRAEKQDWQVWDTCEGNKAQNEPLTRGLRYTIFVS